MEQGSGPFRAVLAGPCCRAVFAGPHAGQRKESCTRYAKEHAMYIGIGTVVLIVIIVLIVLALRR
jgi:hypothetical protein